MFVPGERYKRRDLHKRFGGQQQGGISTPTAVPMVFLVTGSTGHQYGYSDGPQPDGTFWYTGEGQIGDMSLVRGNRAIAEHRKNGNALHLFEDLGNGF